MFRTVEEYILTFGRVPRQPRIISRSAQTADIKVHGLSFLVCQHSRLETLLPGYQWIRSKRRISGTTTLHARQIQPQYKVSLSCLHSMQFQVINLFERSSKIFTRVTKPVKYISKQISGCCCLYFVVTAQLHNNISQSSLRDHPGLRHWVVPQ